MFAVVCFWIVILVIIGFFLLRRRVKALLKEDGSKEDDEYFFINLLAAEQSKWIRAAGVNAITFYEGNIDSAIIKGRLLSIVQSNLWLTSRLIYRGGKYSLRYKKNSLPDTILTDHYKEIIIDSNNPNHLEFKEDSKVQTLFDHVEKDLIPIATKACDNPNAVLFRVLIVKIIEKGKKNVSKTAFIPTLSHAVGDGYTFYQVYKMFDHRATITSFNPFRHHHFDEMIEKRIGPEIVRFIKSPLLILSILISRLFSSKAAVMNFSVNKSVMEESKRSHLKRDNRNADEDHLSTASFISTNDVLTSWFFRQLNVDYGFMAMNYRNRMDGIDDTLVGNYEGSIFYPKKGFSEPRFIRSSLVTSKSKFLRFPTLLELFQCNFGLVSNWSSFYQDVCIQVGHTLIYHSPLLSNSSLAMRGVMIIYCPRHGELAVYIMNHCIKSEKEWRERGEFLEEAKYFSE
eukprot:gene7196-7767_t